MSKDLITINNLSKVYDNGFNALKSVNLKIKQGEIIAMLGPNGAGKTTLISIVCGIVKPSSGEITVDGYDIIKDYRETRSRSCLSIIFYYIISINSYFARTRFYNSTNNTN